MRLADAFLSSRRHLLPSGVPLRTQRATFTALGSCVHEGTDWHPANYKAARAGSCQELRHCFFDFLLAKYSLYWGSNGVAALLIFTCLSIGTLAIWNRLNWQSIFMIFCQPWNCHWPWRLMKYLRAIQVLDFVGWRLLAQCHSVWNSLWPTYPNTCLATQCR